MVKFERRTTRYTVRIWENQKVQELTFEYLWLVESSISFVLGEFSTILHLTMHTHSFPNAFFIISRRRTFSPWSPLSGGLLGLQHEVRLMGRKFSVNSSDSSLRFWYKNNARASAGVRIETMNNSGESLQVTAQPFLALAEEWLALCRVDIKPDLHPDKVFLAQFLSSFLIADLIILPYKQVSDSRSSSLLGKFIWTSFRVLSQNSVWESFNFLGKDRLLNSLVRIWLNLMDSLLLLMFWQ